MVAGASPFVAPLFVPGSRPERFGKAAASGADAVIIDLEDAVAEASKEQARVAATDGAGRLGCPVIVRLNAIGTPWHVEDCRALKGLGLAAVMLPKARSASDVTALSRRLGDAIPIIPLIETAKGLGALAGMTELPSVLQLAFGSIDFALDIGCAHDRTGRLSARSELVWRSRAADLPAPLDGVTASLEDMTVLAADASHAAALGFGGKMAIHPRQTEPIRRAFEPSFEDVAWARRIVASAALDDSAQRIDGTMVDRPILERALRVLGMRRPPSSPT